MMEVHESITCHSSVGTSTVCLLYIWGIMSLYLSIPMRVAYQWHLIAPCRCLSLVMLIHCRSVYKHLLTSQRASTGDVSCASQSLLLSKRSHLMETFGTIGIRAPANEQRNMFIFTYCNTFSSPICHLMCRQQHNTILIEKYKIPFMRYN